MLVRNEYHYDVLSPSELAFLKQKAKKESRTYTIILRIMLVGSVLISFAGAWKNESKGVGLAPVTIFSWELYWLILSILTALFYLSMRFLRSTDLGRIYRDIRKKIKIIERVTIQKKTYLPHNNSFHFYVNSLARLSIEVSATDFELFQEGDEVNIEYSKYAAIYFGYF